MAIVGLGSAIVECVRIRRMIEHHGEAFLRRVFTEREFHDCNANPRVTEQFAGRWVAKEAVWKCLGVTGRGRSWADIEVRQEAGAGPTVRLGGAARDAATEAAARRIHLTIAVTRTYATATAIAVGE